MRIEFQTRKFPEVACDMLAYPVFAGEKADSATLVSLDKATRGILAAVLGSGEFKTDLHHLCVIHHPAGLKAGRLVLIGAGKKEEFTLAILRQVAGTAARAGRNAGCRSVALFDRGDHDPRAAVQVQFWLFLVLNVFFACSYSILKFPFCLSSFWGPL